MSKPTINTNAQLNLFGEEVRAIVAQSVRDGLADTRKAASPTTPLSAYPQRMRRDQVAAFLNCTENHVQNLIDKGKLKAINIAAMGKKKCMRILRESVAELERENQE